MAGSSGRDWRMQRAVVNVSLAGSAFDGQWGGRVGFDVSTSLYGPNLDISTQRALAAYADLAEVTAPPGASPSILANYLGVGVTSPLFSPLLLSTSIAPPRALDRISLTFPRVLELASANFSLVNEVDGNGATSRIASVGVTRNFKGGLSAFATVFADFLDSAGKRDYGVMAGLSYTFGDGISASTQSTLQGRRVLADDGAQQVRRAGGRRLRRLAERSGRR